MNEELTGRPLETQEEASARIGAQIAEARRAQPAAAIAPDVRGQWMPMSDGMVYHHLDPIYEEGFKTGYMESIEFLEVRHDGTVIACGSMPEEEEWRADLPDNVRLCHLVESVMPLDMPDEVRQSMELLVSERIQWDWIGYGAFERDVEIVREWLQSQRPQNGEVSNE